MARADEAGAVAGIPPLPLRARLARRVAAWARTRQGIDALPLMLRSRRLYILPTRVGLAAAVLLFVMLLAGLNYTNSLALLLTFVLAACVLVGMHECQRTLQGLVLQQVLAEDCNAGGASTVRFDFVNPGRQARRALRLGAGSARVAAVPPVSFELEPAASLTVSLQIPALRRGRLRLERLVLATSAPFGLFRSWTWLHLPVDLIVYPCPAGARPLPRAAPQRQVAQRAAQGTGEDTWASLRPYQSGDSPRNIAWKVYARGGALMVGQYEGTPGGECVLSFAGLEALDLESRLSQLSAWVLECARLDAACALRLPGVDIPLGRGARHRTSVLRALALYGLDDGSDLPA